MIRKMTVFMILMAGFGMLYAQAPDWLTKRPRSNDMFYGRGMGNTAEEAEAAALQEIREQVINQVNSMIRLQLNNSSFEVIEQAREKATSWLKTMRLRSSEIEDRYQDGDVYYALAKYPEGGGLTIVQSLALIYEDESEIAPETVLDILDRGAMIRGARIDRVLYDAAGGNYGGDVSVLFRDNTMKVQVVAFDPWKTYLTMNHKVGLRDLIGALAEDLQGLKYTPVNIVGHANPTGVRNEEGILMTISEGRAESMASFLRDANIEVGELKGMGGWELLGSPKTEAGKKLNRRVEVSTEVELW